MQRFFLILVLIAATTPASSQVADMDFVNAVDAFSRGDYSRAIQGFSNAIGSDSANVNAY